MEIYSFNMMDSREKVISDLVNVYNENTELFEDYAYCHFDVDDLTGDIYVFNNVREAEYQATCDYIIDDDGYIPYEDIVESVEYFYDKMIEKAEERTNRAKESGMFVKKTESVKRPAKRRVQTYVKEDTYSRQLTNRELQKLSLEMFIKYTGIKVGLKDIVMLEADTDGSYLFFRVGKLAFAYYHRLGDDEFVAYPDDSGVDGMTIYSQFK